MNQKWNQILDQLEKGTIRASTKIDNLWVVNIEVKKGILEAFKEGEIVQRNGFIDKNNIFPREFNLQDQIRIVPGGTSIRRGAYIGKKVVIMPPSYVNIGAFVDDGTMIDSHVLVGSCAQIGKNVHLSAGVQIGGVLEPISENPVIIEDNCFIGAGVVIVEGIQVGPGAVIAPGVILSKSIPVYDIVNSRVLEMFEPIPENAVVVPGSRAIKNPTNFTTQYSLHMNAAIIVKYRDDKSNTALNLESILR